MKFKNPFSKKNKADAELNGAAEIQKLPKPQKPPKPEKPPKSSKKKKKTYDESEYKTASEAIIWKVCNEKGQLRKIMDSMLEGYNSENKPLTGQEAEKIVFAMLDHASAERTNYMDEFYRICKNGNEAIKNNRRIMEIDALENRVSLANEEFKNAKAAYEEFKKNYEDDKDKEKEKQENAEEIKLKREAKRADLKEKEFASKQELKSLRAEQKLEKIKLKIEKKEQRDLIKNEKARIKLEKQRRKNNPRAASDGRAVPAPKPKSVRVHGEEHMPFSQNGFKISDDSSENMSFGVRDDADKQ